MSHKLVLVRNISGGIFTLPDKSPSITDVGDLVMSEGTKIIGNPGTKGDTGAQGAQGAQGNTGATGAQGAQGNIGATGAQGAQGASGGNIPGEFSSGKDLTDLGGLTNIIFTDSTISWEFGKNIVTTTELQNILR